MTPACYQINLQRHLGGGEVYARFLARTLEGLGRRSVILAHPRARFWRSLLGDSKNVLAVASIGEIESHLEGARPSIFTHGAVRPEWVARLARRGSLAAIVHMPAHERPVDAFRSYPRVFGVSRYVIDTLRERGLTNVHPEPLYGVADLAPRGAGVEGLPCARSPYDWDRRKLRDRALGWLGALAPGGRARRFERRAGLTLGIVSRLTPIKQFPEMFGILAPVLSRLPGVNLEIFGAGGYASVRDLRRALRPMGARARFWGAQPDVASVYPLLDYVLAGLPEREALGLNLLEAQCCGTPVLAVRAPPFTETVAEGETGYFFEDPRRDAGRSFGALLESLLGGRPRPEPRAAAAHLARFSQEAFASRIGDALAALEQSEAREPAPA